MLYQIYQSYADGLAPLQSIAASFGDVLAVTNSDNKLLTGDAALKAKVTGKIVSQGRHPKLTVYKYRCIKQYKIVRGHRQNYTAIQVSGIEL